MRAPAYGRVIECLTPRETFVREHVRSGTETVDGLRGIAILLVVIFHTWLFSWLTPELSLFGRDVPVAILARAGYLGVELFFAISGFVLFFPQAEFALQGGKLPGTRDFIYRRFIKIVPSYALALAATAVVAAPLFHGPRDFAAALANHALFLQNFWSDGFGPVNSVFWSLAIEVQFYVCFPAIARAFRRAPLAVATVMIAVALGYRYAVAACCLQVETVERQLPAFLDVFAFGMLAAYAVVWLRTRVTGLARYRWACTLVALLCVAACIALLQSADAVTYDNGGRERWILWHRTVLAALVALLAVASCLAARWWQRLLANPVLIFLGILSYNLYLWHTLILIWMWRHDVPKAATVNPHDDPHWKIVYIALGWSVCLAVSAAIAYFIERPLLGTVRPQPFAFDWRALGRRAGFTPARPPSARSEKRT
jgi:peptidoglycan/LPS O-acetylase OafA/YrhL